MTKVLVLSGGTSDERAVSLRSGAAVYKALETAGYEVSQLDPANWPEDYEAVLKQADVVFPALHGAGGEDGTIQAWLQDRDIAFVGADSTASQICFDKWIYKRRLESEGIRVPRGQMVGGIDFWLSGLIQHPYVLKPFDGGSSVDTHIVRAAQDTDRGSILESFGRHPKMLLEELVSGQEITVGVLCDEALPVIEIIPPSDGEFDFENKYNGRTQEICPPRSIPEQIQVEAQKIALRIHRLLTVNDMSRTDMIVSPDGRLTVLETNTIPGLTEQSLLPKAALAAGYDMPALCSKLVEASLARSAKTASAS